MNASREWTSRQPTGSARHDTGSDGGGRHFVAVHDVVGRILGVAGEDPVFGVDLFVIDRVPVCEVRLSVDRQHSTGVPDCVTAAIPGDVAFPRNGADNTGSVRLSTATAPSRSVTRFLSGGMASLITSSS